MPQADYYERQEARRERYELRAERAHAWMKEVNKAFKKGDAALLALGKKRRKR